MEALDADGNLIPGAQIDITIMIEYKVLTVWLGYFICI